MGLCWSSPGGGGGGSFDGTLSGAAPSLIFQDTDAAVTRDNASIAVNLTDTGDGTEDADLTISCMVDGSLSEVIKYDASIPSVGSYDNGHVLINRDVQMPEESVIGNSPAAGASQKGISFGTSALRLKFLNFTYMDLTQTSWNFNTVKTHTNGDSTTAPNWIRDSSQTTDGLSHGGSGYISVICAGATRLGVKTAQIELNEPTIFPNMDNTARDALTAVAGMVIYSTTDSKLQVYTSAWETITSS